MSPRIELVDINRLGRYARDQLGMQFDESRSDALAEALARGIERTALPQAGTYLDALQNGTLHANERQALIENLTVTETYFFRNGPQYDALIHQVIPVCLRANAESRCLRILSAGCSSGEEAYSCAITLREHFPELSSWRLSITGFDVNEAALTKARQARYTAWSLRETADSISTTYFRKAGGEYILDPVIQKSVTWHVRNLIAEDPQFWHASAFDVIFCRNVLMYFAPDAARSVISRFSHALADHGYLFLGHAETLRGLTQEFQVCHSHEAFYYRHRAAGSEKLKSAIPASKQYAAPLLPSLLSEPASWITAIQESALRIDNLTQATTPSQTKNERPQLAQRQLGRISELMQHEKYAEALAILEPTPDDDADLRLLHSVILVHCGRLEEAETICNEILRNDDLQAGAHFLLALCREHAKDFSGAAEHDRTAVYLDPGFVMPRLHLGLMARRAGNLETARNDLRQALILLPREDVARILLFGGGFTRDALTHLCQAELRACD